MAVPTVKLWHEHFPGLRDADTRVAVSPAHYIELRETIENDFRAFPELTLVKKCIPSRCPS